MARLATFYGTIAELQWRLRARLELPTLAAALDAITEPLAEELADEVTDLLTDVAAQVASPDVQPLGLVHNIRIETAYDPPRPSSFTLSG